MSQGPTRMDQGLFLAHFTKGKELFEARKFAEAEVEFEEAYLLKPRDLQVLNLLGIVYFKQEKLARAEEVYRKLLAESPEAHTLYYNLGLIYLKLGRLEEAEPAFLKALDLAAENPKIHFYLGSIYERLQRFQDAIYRYRQAGAFMMVRRVEDKIAAPVKRRDDTAEFKAKEVHAALQNMATDLAPAKKVEPVSPRLMAEWVPRDGLTPGPKKDDTARFRRDTSPFPLTPPTSGAPVSEHTAPVGTADIPHFRLLGRGLLEVCFSGKVFIKQGTIYSYSGNLTFWVKEPRGDAPPPLVIVTGNGRLILTDHDREVTLVEVRDEKIHVDPRHVLAADEGLIPRMVQATESTAGLEFLEIEGRGTVALSVASRPLTLSITPDLPASVPAASVIYWNGTLVPRAVDDSDVLAVMSNAGARPGALVRLEGTGQLMVEQWLG
jgi:Flp pilus assembly protein TadD